MRILFTPVLALLPLSLSTLSPAMAANNWRQSCTGPEFVCGSASAPAKSVTAMSAAQPSIQKTAKAKSKARNIATADATPSKPKKKLAVKAKSKPKAEVAKAPVKAKANAKVAKSSGGGSSFQSGMASWYGGKFHGRTTANGEKYNMDALTAAHKTLPFGTRVRVTNTRNGDSVDVRINDRGPFIAGRIIDLSRAAASQIGLQASGVASVKVAILGKG